MIGRRVRVQDLFQEPSATQWLIEHALNGRSPAHVHVGGCWSSGKRSRGVARNPALRALTKGVAPGPQCRPDTELGLLDRAGPSGRPRARREPGPVPPAPGPTKPRHG
ncbi:DUF6233 domain-containing protein [Streptomyces sp. AC627_RSS907]|uniref:DUF6233 domain-containing protein n=1 Tax=Streptomyces sp. AC627_RSS907 TaxID=2823684 RepID=UPI0020B7F135|nr:DUF6233 domain-containing protein [Streptomyces sp. AC627_RSS907]